MRMALVRKLMAVVRRNSELICGESGGMTDKILFDSEAEDDRMQRSSWIGECGA
jgi:hypothetical protein